MAHRKLTCLIAILFTSVGSAARATPDVIFGTGRGVSFSEQSLDRKFLKTKLARQLDGSLSSSSCEPVLAGMLTLLGEIGPYLHRRDDTFYLDPHLIEALTHQLNTPNFPANTYLAMMVRRLMIDRTLPPGWLRTAAHVNAHQSIDLSKIRYLADGVRPIDSFYFTLSALQDRFKAEVVQATSVSKKTALLTFKDNYLDRDVTWNGLSLVDIDRSAKSSQPLARLELKAPSSPQDRFAGFFGRKKKTAAITVTARLSAQQYFDLSELPKGARLLVHGRFWEMNAALTELEVRDAVLFEDRDFGQGISLASPELVAACPAAVDELSNPMPP